LKNSVGLKLIYKARLDQPVPSVMGSSLTGSDHVLVFL